jgi:hypothetical protein
MFFLQYAIQVAALGVTIACSRQLIMTSSRNTTESLDKVDQWSKESLSGVQVGTGEIVFWPEDEIA